MRRNSPFNNVNNTTTTTTTQQQNDTPNSPDTDDSFLHELNQIGRLSNDDFVGRNVPSLNRINTATTNPTPNATATIPTPSSNTIVSNTSDIITTPEVLTRTRGPITSDHINSLRDLNARLRRTRQEEEIASSLNNNPDTTTHDDETLNALQRQLDEIRAQAIQRAEAAQNDVDVALNIADRMRELRLETIHLLNNMGNWAYNHPWLTVTTITAITGAGIFMIRGYRAMGVATLATRGGGLVENVVHLLTNTNNTTNSQTNHARRELTRTLTNVSTVGGLFFVVTIIIRGLRR